MNGNTGDMGMTMAADEGGLSDNRLILNPNDELWKATVEAWEDGQEYDVSLRIRQNSPGDFTVLSLAAEGGELPEEPLPSETGAMGQASDETEGRYSSTATKKLMEGRV